MLKPLLLIFLILIPTTAIATANVSPGVNITITTQPLSYISPGNSGGGSSSGGSSGGGGGGVSSDESYSNIAQAYRIEKDWRYNGSITYTTPYDITEVVVRSNLSESEVSLLLNILRNGSSKIVAPNATVYKYFNLYLGSKKYSEVMIKFRVNQSVTGIIGLMNFNGTKWNDVSMNNLYSDRNYTYYQAISTNISPKFAIVVRPKPMTPTSTPTIAGTPKVMATIVVTNATSDMNNSSTKESPPLSPVIIIIGVIVVILMIVGYFLTA